MYGLNETIDPREMLRLRDMLDAAGVEYECDDSELPSPLWEGRMKYHTMSRDFRTNSDGCVAGFSAVLAPFSYGGADGLLELWARGMDEPCGYLSAENVMEKLRKAGLA